MKSPEEFPHSKPKPRKSTDIQPVAGSQEETLDASSASALPAPDNTAKEKIENAERINDPCEMLDHSGQASATGRSGTEKQTVIDAGPSLRHQHAEHYEIGPDGSVRHYAKRLGKDEAAKFLQEVATQKPGKRKKKRAVA